MRKAWAGLLLLEQRLADAAREGRDPIMVQLRLAWWRDRLGEPAAQWPKGEPLLAILDAWDGERAALSALVDGHEAARVGEDGGAALALARTGTVLALARMAALSEAHAIGAASAWGHGEPVPSGLPKALRPLQLLDHFTRATGAPPIVLLGAIRKGLLGY